MTYDDYSKLVGNNPVDYALSVNSSEQDILREFVEVADMEGWFVEDELVDPDEEEFLFYKGELGNLPQALEHLVLMAQRFPQLQYELVTYVDGKAACETNILDNNDAEVHHRVWDSWKKFKEYWF